MTMSSTAGMPSVIQFSFGRPTCSLPAPEQYENIGVFTSVISILKTIDKSKILWKKDKKYCAMCIQNQTTLYEGLWLHYYNVLKKKDAELLCKYHIIDGIPQSELFAIAE